MAIPGGGAAAGAAASGERARARPKARVVLGALGRFTIMPSSPGKITFDILMMMCLAYTVTTTPLTLAFGISASCPTPAFVIDLLIDILFIVDLVANFVTLVPMTNEAGDAILSGKLDVIAKRYLKTWFVIDAISSLPALIDAGITLSVSGCSDEAAATKGHDTGEVSELLRMIRLLRMVKLLKILRVLKLRQKYHELCDYLPQVANLRFTQLLSIGVIALYTSHVLSCGFYFVGVSVFYSSRHELSWLCEADFGYDLCASGAPPTGPNTTRLDALSWDSIGP